MVNWFSVGLNAFNIVITFALLVFTIKLRDVFKGGTIATGIKYLIGSAAFFLIAALSRATTISQLVSPDFEPLAYGLRAIAFVLLFLFLAKFVKDWKSLGK